MTITEQIKTFPKDQQIEVSYVRDNPTGVVFDNFGPGELNALAESHERLLKAAKAYYVTDDGDTADAIEAAITKAEKL